MASTIHDSQPVTPPKSNTTHSSPFLDLPSEIRTQIYRSYFTNAFSYFKTDALAAIRSSPHFFARMDPRTRKERRALLDHAWTQCYTKDILDRQNREITCTRTMSSIHTDTALLRTCKHIYYEAIPIYQSARVVSIIEEDPGYFFTLLRGFISLRPVSFLQSIRHLHCDTVSFVPFIDREPLRIISWLSPAVRPEFQEFCEIFATNVFPNLLSLTLDTEHWRHSLRDRNMSVPAQVVHDHSKTEGAWLSNESIRPKRVITALKAFAVQWPHVKEVVWRLHLHWSVQFMTYGTIHTTERFGWNTYIYDAKLDMMCLKNDECWSGECEIEQ